MSAQPWLKFFPSDWRADSALRMCSPAARCLWIEMICLMHEAEPLGHLLVKGRPLSDRALAIQAGMTVEDVTAGLTDLEQNGVFSRTSAGVIISRKMVRDGRKSEEQSAKAKKRWGSENADKSPSGNSEGDAIGNGNAETMPHIPEARSQKLEPEPDSPSRPAVATPPAGGSPAGKDEGEKLPALVKDAKPRPSRLPLTWQPDDKLRAYALGIGFRPAEVDEIAEDFVGYFCSGAAKKPTRDDWGLSWMRWCREDRKRREARGQRFDGQAGGVRSPKGREWEERRGNLRAGLVEALIGERGSGRRDPVDPD